MRGRGGRDLEPVRDLVKDDVQKRRERWGPWRGRRAGRRKRLVQNRKECMGMDRFGAKTGVSLDKKNE